MSLFLPAALVDVLSDLLDEDKIEHPDPDYPTLDPAPGGAVYENVSREVVPAVVLARAGATVLVSRDYVDTDGGFISEALGRFPDSGQVLAQRGCGPYCDDDYDAWLALTPIDDPQAWARDAANEAMDLAAFGALWRAFPRQAADALAGALSEPGPDAPPSSDTDPLDALIDRLGDLALARQAEALAERLPGITALSFATCAEYDYSAGHFVAVVNVTLTLTLAGTTVTLEVDEDWSAIELLDNHERLALADGLGLPADAPARAQPQALAEALVARLPESLVIETFADRVLARQGKTYYRFPHPQGTQS